MSPPFRSFLFRAARFLGVLSLVAVVTFVDLRVLNVNSSTAAFSYLLVVLALAARGSLAESATASFAAMLCYNFFFLPPFGQLTIADPQNWVALLVFLITAITASQLSASAQRRAREASAGRLESKHLYEFSRALMLGGEQPLHRRIVQQAVEVFTVRESAFYDAHSSAVSRAGEEEWVLPETLLQQVAQTGENWRSESAAASIVPVRLGNRVLGSFGWAGALPSLGALSATAQLAAIAIERTREQQIATRLEAARENEQLKATLLDAMAHEFKTPLTSIKAAITTVLSQREHDGVEHELLTVVDEEADHLTGLVNETIKIARIEAGRVKLHRERFAVRALIAATLAKLKATDNRDIQVNIPSGTADLDIDIDLGELALRQLVSNSLKYAPPSSAISISAEPHPSHSVAIHVANEGPAIPAAEQDAIFERFYRARHVRDRIPGSGLGLTVAREIAEAHGGSLTLGDSGRARVEFTLALPAVSDE